MKVINISSSHWFLHPLGTLNTEPVPDITYWAPKTSTHQLTQNTVTQETPNLQKPREHPED